jgi:hypothetical protein
LIKGKKRKSEILKTNWPNTLLKRKIFILT